MRLNIYHSSKHLLDGPLLAEVHASGQATGKILRPYEVGTVTCYRVDPDMAGPGLRSHLLWLNEHLESDLLRRLGEKLRVTRGFHDGSISGTEMVHVPAWSREAFCLYASQPRRLLDLTRIEFFENDGTLFVPSPATLPALFDES